MPVAEENKRHNIEPNPLCWSQFYCGKNVPSNFCCWPFCDEELCGVGLTPDWAGSGSASTAPRSSQWNRLGKQKERREISRLSFGPSDTFLGGVPLVAWLWAAGLQASNVIRALEANFFIESWKVTFSKLWYEDKTMFMLIFREQMDRSNLGMRCIPAVEAHTAGLLTGLWLCHTTQEQDYSLKLRSRRPDFSSPLWEPSRGTVELLYGAASSHSSHSNTLTMFLQMDIEKRMMLVAYL